jgi:hypothetical protein
MRIFPSKFNFSAFLQFIRNRRFVSVLHALGTPTPVSGTMAIQSSSSSGAHTTSQGQGQGQSQGQVQGQYNNAREHTTQSSGEINRNAQCHAQGTTLACCGTCGHGPATGAAAQDDDKSLPAKRMRATPPSEAMALENPSTEIKALTHPETAPGLSTSHYHFPTGRRCSPRPIDALRFERVGTHEWCIVETKVYDVCEFMKMLALDMGDTPVCLIDESVLQKSLGFMPKKMASKIGLGGIGYKSTLDGVMSLTKELTLNNSMITSWTKSERPQLREMACQWQWQKQLPAIDSEESGSKDETMITFWRSSDTTDFSLGGRNSCLCNGCTDAENTHPCGGSSSSDHSACGCDGENGVHKHHHDQNVNMVMNQNMNMNQRSIEHGRGSPMEHTSANKQSVSSSSEHSSNFQHQSRQQANAPYALQHNNVHISQLHMQFTHNQPKGYLVYEQTLQVGVVVRANASIGLTEDLWCMLFPTELNPLTNSETFGILLSRLFPQLTVLYGDSNEWNPGDHVAASDARRRAASTAVKYYPHPKGHAVNHPPAAPENSQSYRTVGTVSMAASTLLARYTILRLLSTITITS